MDEARKTQMLAELVRLLSEERGLDPEALLRESDLWPAFRALVNTREPVPADAKLLERQDELLQGLRAERGVHALA